MDRLVGVGHEQCLTVGVHSDELDALHARLDHTVDRIRAAAANADDLDDGQMLGCKIDRHVIPLTGSHLNCIYLYSAYNHFEILHDEVGNATNQVPIDLRDSQMTWE